MKGRHPPFAGPPRPPWGSLVGVEQGESRALTTRGPFAIAKASVQRSVVTVFLRLPRPLACRNPR